MPVQHRPYFLRSMVLISGKLDLAIADLRHFGQLALEVILHYISDGVKLHANFFYFVSCSPGHWRANMAAAVIVPRKSSIVFIIGKFSSLHLIDSIIASPCCERHVSQRWVYARRRSHTCAVGDKKIFGVVRLVVSIQH